MIVVGGIVIGVIIVNRARGVCVCVVKGVCIHVIERAIVIENIDFVGSGVVGLIGIICVLIHNIFTTKSVPNGLNEAACL